MSRFPMPSEKPTTDVAVRVFALTASAVLVKEESWGIEDEAVWIPLSQVETSDDLLGAMKTKEVVGITIPEWIAEQKELL